MNLQEQNQILKNDLLELEKKENEVKSRITLYKSMLLEKERKQKRVQILLEEEKELLSKLGL